MSLISAVKDLHEKASLLHCDIKPDNVLWDGTNTCIRLIDFGHSQSEMGAKFYPATEKFEAPEIINRQPHSHKTDAYSVGATILFVLEEAGYIAEEGVTQHQSLSMIHKIGMNLVEENPLKHWSLDESLLALQGTPMDNGQNTYG